MARRLHRHSGLVPDVHYVGTLRSSRLHVHRKLRRNTNCVQRHSDADPVSNAARVHVAVASAIVHRAHFISLWRARSRAT